MRLNSGEKWFNCVTKSLIHIISHHYSRLNEELKTKPPVLFSHTHATDWSLSARRADSHFRLSMWASPGRRKKTMQLYKCHVLCKASQASHIGTSIVIVASGSLGFQGDLERSFCFLIAER